MMKQDAPGSAKAMNHATVADMSYLAYVRPTPAPFTQFVSGHFPPGTSTQRHRHSCIAIHGCLQGPLVLQTAKRAQELEVGDFCLLAADIDHHWRNPSRQTGATFGLLVDAGRPGRWPAAADVGGCCDRLAKLVTGVHHFRQRLEGKHEDPAAANDLAVEIRRLLMARVNDRLSIGEIARELKVSPTSAKESFRRAFGTGIIAYHSQLKIWQAKRLLADHSLTVDQVSRRLGFSSHSYFSQVFQQHTGRSPTEFRRAAAKPSRPRIDR